MTSTKFSFSVILTLLMLLPFTRAQDFSEEPLANVTAADFPEMNTTGNMTTNVTEAPSAAPTLAPTPVPTFQGGITEECLNETETLNNNTELSSSLENLLSRYRSEFKSQCPASVTSSQCNVKFGNGGNGTYDMLCQQKGGQIYEHSVNLRCGVPPLAVNYDLGTVPQCIGASCNVSRISNFALLTSSNISNFGSSLNNGACSGSIKSGAAHGRWMTTAWALSWTATINIGSIFLFMS